MNTFEKIENIVRKIPRGKVAYYGMIAKLAGMKRGARVVGYAMAACRDEDVPCHRVVDKSGGTKTAFDVFERGVQRALLEEEGVTFTENGKVDMRKHLWTPENSDFCHHENNS